MSSERPFSRGFTQFPWLFPALAYVGACSAWIASSPALHDAVHARRSGDGGAFEMLHDIVHLSRVIDGPWLRGVYCVWIAMTHVFAAFLYSRGRSSPGRLATWTVATTIVLTAAVQLAPFATALPGLPASAVVAAFMLAVPAAILALPAVPIFGSADRAPGGRAASIGQGTHRAFWALAVLSAGLVVPWWLRPNALALAVVTGMTLAAAALTLEAEVVLRTLQRVEACFVMARAIDLSEARGAASSIDLGFGDGYRCKDQARADSYRRAPRGELVVCRGAAAPGEQALRALVRSGLGVVALGAAQVVLLAGALPSAR